MKKLILINCYFGKLPEYIDFYLKSAGANPTVDFLLVTDDKTQRDYPQNVIVKYMSFEDTKEKIQSIFDFEISLNSPYKLCDYKPTYGKVFYEIVKNYDFWGYADIDLILGDIRSFITDEVLVSHDKIQSAGHFTVLPTDEEGINFFTYEIDGISYKKAFTTDQSLAFDEWAGVSTVYKILNKKVYNEVNDFSDLSYKHWYFLPSEEVYRRGSCEKKWWSSNIVYLWQKGYLYTVALSDEGKVTKKPCMYVHFQKRKVVAKCEVADEFLILPPGKIVTYNEEITPKFLKKYAKEKKFYFAYFKLRYKNLIKKLKK